MAWSRFVHELLACRVSYRKKILLILGWIKKTYLPSFKSQLCQGVASEDLILRIVSESKDLIRKEGFGGVN